MRELALEEDRVDLQIAVEKYVELDEEILDLTATFRDVFQERRWRDAIEEQDALAHKIAALVVSIGFPDVGAE